MTRKESKELTKNEPMRRSKFLIFISVLVTFIAASWGFDQGIAQAAKSKLDKVLKYHGKISPTDRKAAADRAAAAGFTLEVMGEAMMAMPGAARPSTTGSMHSMTQPSRGGRIPPALPRHKFGLRYSNPGRDCSLPGIFCLRG
jgi:hypothetical protein